MRLLSFFLFAVATASLLMAAGQSTPGAIQGTVLNADGKVIPRATLYYGRTARVRSKAAGSVLPPVLSTKAGLDGKFTLPNLAPGAWTVCVEASGYLNPCHWSQSPSFTIASGQTVANVTVRLDASYTLHIRITDPLNLLANDGKTPGAVMQIGVHAPSGAFQRATLASKGTGSREYTVAVPLRSAARVFVHGGAFQLNDDAGTPLANGGRVTSFTPPAAATAGATFAAGPASASGMGFTVTGLRKP